VVSLSFRHLASFVSVDKFAAPKHPTFHTRERTPRMPIDDTLKVPGRQG